MDTSNSDFIFQFAAAVDPDGSNGIYFVARQSGLFRSTDSGQTWELAYESLKVRDPLPTHAVALSPNFAHEPCVYAGLNGAILHSLDGGIRWANRQLPSPPPAISSLAVSPNYEQDGTVFAGTNEDGIIVSTDRGIRWVSWNFGLLDLTILCLAISPDFSKDETLYAGTGSGLFRSTNGGRAWRELPLPIGFDAVLSLAISPNFAQDDTLFIGTENNGILTSRDRGKSWSPLAELLREQPVNFIILSSTSQAPQEILILHGGTLLISKDGGKNWKPWQAKKVGTKDVTAILPADGTGRPALVGFSDGTIKRIEDQS